MVCLKITLYPVDFETPFSLNDCVMSIAILAEETGLGYRLNSSGATIEGNERDLLTFLRRLKDEVFRKLADKVVMIASFPREDQFFRHTGGSGPISTRPEPIPKRSLADTVLDMIG